MNQAPVLLRLDVLTTGEQLAAIAPAWTALWQELDASVFQSHAWVHAWWSTLPASHRYRLRIGLVWQGERLRAVFPLTTVRRKGIRFLEWAAISCTDYPDVLAAPDCTTQTLRRLWQTIETWGGYDVVQLLRLLPDAQVRPVIGPLTSHGQHRNELNYRVVGDFSGPGGWLAQQSKKSRQNYRRGYQFLGEDAAVRFRLVDPRHEPLAPLVAQFEALKRKWLVGLNKQSELLQANDGAVAALVSVLAEQDRLRAFVLERNGEPVAISFNFEEAGALRALLTTYDPAYERASPGMVLIADYIQWAADHGLRTVDFLCGGEAFKLRFSTQTVLLEGQIAARTPLGHAALAAHAILRQRRERQAQGHGNTVPAAPEADPAA